MLAWMQARISPVWRLVNNIALAAKGRVVLRSHPSRRDLG